MRSKVRCSGMRLRTCTCCDTQWHICRYAFQNTFPELTSRYAFHTQNTDLSKSMSISLSLPRLRSLSRLHASISLLMTSGVEMWWWVSGVAARQRNTVATRREDMVRTEGEREMHVSCSSTAGCVAIGKCTSGSSLKLEGRERGRQERKPRASERGGGSHSHRYYTWKHT